MPETNQTTRIVRRLAAVLVADVAGFSALVGADEDRAINSFKSHVNVLEPIIRMHSGRMVKGTGDGFLVEFQSVVDAVSCAQAMRRLMAERNTHETRETRIDFRMGIHCGDVIVDGTDILGDGVNIAARLEAVAEPGGFVVSARVRDDVMGKLDVSFKDLGQIEFKNISQPVQVFGVAPAVGEPLPSVVGLPDKPSVAVLPFENRSVEDEDEYLADGIAEDIIVALANVPWVFVVARNSSFSYKGLSTDVRQIARELGVRYILEGSLRRMGGRLRSTAELIDAESGETLWAKRFDGVIEDIFDLQDEISASVAASIAPKIQSAEIARVLKKSSRNLDAYDMYLRGQHVLHLGRIEEARDWFEKALNTAPGFAKAYAKHAWTTTVWHYFGRTASDEERTESLNHARTALEEAPDDPEVLAYSGYTIGFLERDFAYALELVERATSVSPSFAWAWSSSSLLSAYVGDAGNALERAAVAMRLSPRDPFSFRTYIAVCLANVIEGDFGALLDNATKGASLNPRPINFHYHRAIALAQLGRPNEATAACRRVLEIDPEFSVGAYIGYCRDNIGISDVLNNPLEAGLRKAGFPQ